MPGLFDRFGRPKRSEAFGGEVYCMTDVAIDDLPRRFSTEMLKLRDVVIQVHTHAQAFGTFDIRDYEVQPGDTIGFTRVDLASLYFVNLNAGQNGSVTILGVRE